MTDAAPDIAEDRLAALQELDLIGGGRFAELDNMVALAADICGANLAAFTVHDREQAFEVALTFGEPGFMPRGECMCGAPLAAGATVSVSDAPADPRLAKARYVAGAPHVRSFIGVPLGAEPGIPVGVLAVGHTEPGVFGDREMARLEQVAGLVSAFLVQRRDAVRATRLAAVTEAERQRQHLFELIFNAIQEGVNVYALDGRVAESNAAALSFIGLSREEQIGRGTNENRVTVLREDGSIWPPEEFPIAVTLRTGQSFRDVRLGVLRPGGEKRWVSANTGPVHDPVTGRMTHAVMTFADITAQREAEERVIEHNAQLADALAEAEKASRAKSDFMGVMSHELRTPMNAVMSCALLLSQSKLDPIQRRTLGVMEDASKQMLAVLNDLFDLSAINADKVRIEREPTSLLRLIEDAAVIWAADVRAKGLSLSVIIDPSLSAPRNADSARLLQVIGNLVANAVKFTQRGGISLHAWPERGSDGSQFVAIEVADTGPGVPQEAAERIFQPFEQVDATARRRHGGLGLGLHIARRLAMAMGGDITLETTPGEGSRFTVRIVAPLDDSAAKEGASFPAEGEAEFQTREILCVDDNPRNLFVLGAMLRAAGHKTTECGSGAEALALLGQRKFDVVLLDMVMPDMDGLDVLSQVRAGGGPNAETPVIACTANVLPDQIESYRKAGTAGVLAKPIDPRAMLAAIAAA